MNTELLEALNILEREKSISKEALMEAIENSLLTACKNHFGKADNMHVNMNRETGDFEVIAEKTIVEHVEDPVTQISLEKAKAANSAYEAGDVVNVRIDSKDFGRIATQNAKNVILQKIREEERKALFSEYYEKEHEVVTGVIQRIMNKSINVNLGKTDGILNESEMVKGENYYPNQRLKVYVVEVKDTPADRRSMFPEPIRNL